MPWCRDYHARTLVPHSEILQAVDVDAMRAVKIAQLRDAVTKNAIDAGTLTECTEPGTQYHSMQLDVLVVDPKLAQHINKLAQLVKHWRYCLEVPRRCMSTPRGRTCLPPNAEFTTATLERWIESHNRALVDTLTSGTVVEPDDDPKRWETQVHTARGGY